MATANEQLQDMQIFEQHNIESFKNSTISTMLTFFKRMEKLVEKEITSFYNEENPLQKDKVVLLKKVKKIQATELNKIKTRTMVDAEKFLGVEANTYKRQLETVLGDVEEVIAIKNIDPAKLKK